MKNKKHNREIIYKAIHEYETTSLSNREVREKYGNLDESIFFKYLRQKRQQDKLEKQKLETLDPYESLDYTEHSQLPVQIPEQIIPKPKQIKPKHNNKASIYAEMGAISILSEKTIEKPVEKPTNKIERVDPSSFELLYQAV